MNDKLLKITDDTNKENTILNEKIRNMDKN